LELVVVDDDDDDDGDGDDGGEEEGGAFEALRGLCFAPLNIIVEFDVFPLRDRHNLFVFISWHRGLMR
jgi:hypothetical protein